MNQVPRATQARLPWLGHGSRYGSELPQEAVSSAALVAATLAAVATAAYLGRLNEALVVVLAILLMPVFVKRPLVLALLYLVISTNLFETLPLSAMTAVHVGSGMVLKVPDVLVILMLCVAVVRLGRRRERPMFLGFVILWCVYVTFQFLYGYAVGETGPTLWIVMAQDQVGWVMYLLIVALIDSPRDLRIFGWFFLAIMSVAVFYQVAEYIHGGRILLFHVSVPGYATYYDINPLVMVGGVKVPYLWSRASLVTIVGFFLAFAAVLDGRRLRVYGPLAAAGLLSIALTQIRSMYFGVAVGILAILGLRAWNVTRLVRLLALVCILVVMVAALTPLISSSFGGSPTAVWLARASLLTRYSTDVNWIKRVDDARRAWDSLKESPLVGFGWGKTYLRLQGESGMNTMLVHGLLGTVMILALYLAVLFKAIRLGRRLMPCLERSWLFGLVGAMVVQLAMAPTSNYLMSGGLAVIVAVFVDRISAFEAHGLLAGTSAAAEGSAKT